MFDIFQLKITSLKPWVTPGSSYKPRLRKKTRNLPPSPLCLTKRRRRNCWPCDNPHRGREITGLSLTPSNPISPPPLPLIRSTKLGISFFLVIY